MTEAATTEATQATTTTTATATTQATPVTAAAGLAETKAEPKQESGLKLPGADAKPEDWQAFYRQIGAPEKAEDYGIKAPEGQDDAFAKEAAGEFAKFGLRKDQASGITAWWNAKVEALAKADAEAKAANDKAMQVKNDGEQAALKSEWGQSYDTNVAMAKRAVTQYFGDKAEPILQAIESQIGFGATYRVMHTIGKGLGEGTARGLTNETPPVGSALENFHAESLRKAGLLK